MIALTEQNKIKSAASPAGAGAGGRPAAGWWKRRVVALWMGWERLFHVLFRVRPVGDGTSFHYRVIRYGGRPLPLSNGETLRAGDHVMELHFDNQMMYEIGMTSKSEVHTAIRVIRKVEETLPEIADELALLRDKERIKALYGVTMINRGTEPLGFEAFEMTPGLFAWLTNRYLRLLMSIIHPRGHERLRTGSERMRPRMLVMPVDLVVQWGVTRTRPSKAQRQRAEKRESPDAPLRVAEERMTETSM